MSGTTSRTRGYTDWPRSRSATLTGSTVDSLAERSPVEFVVHVVVVVVRMVTRKTPHQPLAIKEEFLLNSEKQISSRPISQARSKRWQRSLKRRLEAFASFGYRKKHNTFRHQNLHEE
jgi:hypothetical protein